MSIENPLPCQDAVIVRSEEDAIKLLRTSGNGVWPGCWVAGPIPGESLFCRTPRELIKVDFGHSPAWVLTPRVPDK